MMKKDKSVIIFGIWLVVAPVLILIIINISENSFSKSWEQKNNINPIKSSLNSTIDSIGREGRYSYFRLSDGKEFVIDISPEKKVLISTFLSKIDIGDSLIKSKESKVFTVIKKNQMDKITFEVRNDSADYD
tara:strand:- start:849 stop:1244 length:396 start_codon:yes stop_codon:yes gene_type:complete